MNRIFAAIILISMVSFSTIRAAESLNDELTKCAAMTRDLQRLSCYDQLSGKAATYPIEAVKSRKSASTVTNTADSNFGLKQKHLESVPASNSDFGLKAKIDTNDIDDVLTSYIPGDFKGWAFKTKLKLANGQVWMVVDKNDKLFYRIKDPKVTISRGIFNSYRLAIEGSEQTAKVSRVK